MKIALAQINTTAADINGNRQKIIENITKAKASGADIIVFPEMATVGYAPMDLLGNRKLLLDNTASIELIAKECRGIACICGFLETDTKSSAVFNSAAFIQDGAIVSKHQKTILKRFDFFDETRYFSPGSARNIIDFMGRKIGITIGEDLWEADVNESNNAAENPIMHLKTMGAEIIINISASPFTQGKDRARAQKLQSLSSEYDTAIVFINQVGGNDSLVFDGNNLFVNNKGQITAHGDGFAETLSIADTNSSTPLAIKYDELDSVRRALVLGLRDYAHKCGFTSCLLGLSGGIDSALVCALACEALGSDNVFAITMPSMFSSKGSIDDSVALAKNLGVRLENIPIHNIYNCFIKDLDVLFQGMDKDITGENLQARIRGTLLMAVSNKTGSLLLATGNKSEAAMGYCTLYGDTNGGLSVIADITKTLVYKLSNHINRERIIIPQEIIDKPPSAELSPGQRDEDSLPPYDILDRILAHYMEERLSAEEIIALGFDRETVLHVLNTVNSSEYKRRQSAISLRVTAKTFEAIGAIPLAQKYRP